MVLCNKFTRKLLIVLINHKTFMILMSTLIILLRLPEDLSFPSFYLNNLGYFKLRLGIPSLGW